MKILYFHHNQPDYLAESLFHGLRSLLGKDCIDVPRYDSMYAPLTDKMQSKLRGNGFTLYGLLEELPELAEQRFFWQSEIEQYDLIVIANIWNQWELLGNLVSTIPPTKIAILDGADQPAVFPFSSMLWRLKHYPWSFFLNLSKIKYFKRELISGGFSYGLDRFLPPTLHQLIPLPNHIFSISFSIPKEKIYHTDPETKIKDFPQHLVDQEIANHIQNSLHSPTGSNIYSFSTEEEYYQDLRQSRYGITTKRAGWDCLRHYELAANGCVLCFRDLDLKPIACAPHGLNESNCIIYHSFDELNAKIASITESQYLEMQQKTYQWIEANTTVARATQFLKACSSN
jgi:hypothetical protein